MKRILGTLSCCILGMSMILSYSFAANEKFSCQIGDIQPPQYAEGLLNTIGGGDEVTRVGKLQVFTRRDLEIAVTLLKRTCCQQGLLAEASCEGQTQGPNYQPQSAYLVDHLMFVAMTKFDGDTEVCQALGLEGCDMADPELDVEPVKRREEIRRIARDTDGYSAEQILKLFELYRGEKTGLGPDEEGNMIKGYYRMCTEIKEIATLSFTTNSEINAYDKCRARVQLRYEQERAYVQTLMVEKGVQALGNMMREYLKEYFVDQRLSGLVTKYGVLDACWRMVLKTVDHTPCCNE